IDSVAEPSLQLAVRGFEPLAVTDCLNYGNPENKRIMGEFVASLKGMNEMCRELSAPIISGNVSFYNETEGRNITSTPATGLVGLSTRETVPEETFTTAGEKVFLVTLDGCATGGILQERANGQTQAKGQLDPKKIAQFARELMGVKNAKSAKLVGRAGLGQTLARMCLTGVGASLNVQASWLGGERLYEVVFAGGSELENELKKLSSVRVTELGLTGGDTLKLNDSLQVKLEELKTAYFNGWRRHFENLA
ncbi:MAG TPA: AIR synthase related protein, partial [Bdellovibrionales bacterium]|nr:AIR synthase related protein [Bdellovibrionales bacterium]